VQNVQTLESKSGRDRRGGLHGKARKNHRKNRAWRLQSQQMIEEFVAPKVESHDRPRQVPIRRRAEFVPSAPVLGSEYGVGRDDELELVYATGSEDGSGIFDDAYALVSESSESESAIKFAPSDATVDRDEREALMKYDSAEMLAPGRVARHSESFTAQGFALGCALGTAAAAMLLVMVRAVFL
jgi:hypothetical protein